MTLRGKVTYSMFFIVSLSCALFGIFQLGKEGGPCNAGLGLLILVPVVLICILLIIPPFITAITQNNNSSTFAISLAIISFVIWTIAIFIFADAEEIEDTLLLTVFEIFIITTLVISIRLKDKV